jgi:hypothetical protein
MTHQATQYENQGGLLVKPGANECAGYILCFDQHGAYDPTGEAHTPTGPSKEEVDAHNAILAHAEREAMIKHGVGTFYISESRAPKCTPQNPRWRIENNGGFTYSDARVTQFTGGWKAPWCYVRHGYSYGFCRVETRWVWFTGPDGLKWYGVNKGYMDCFTGRRMKRQDK